MKISRLLCTAALAAVFLSASLVVVQPAPVSAATTTTTASTSTVKLTAAQIAAKKRRAAKLRRARSVLAALKRKYRHLDGVTVTIGKTPGGYQAVSYYTAGRIVISPKHRASIERILKHEVWHIIDWRDNGRIDWRESVPPRNAASYLK